MKVNFIFLLLFISFFAEAQNLTSLTKSAKEIGLLVANKFVASAHGVYGGNNIKPHIPYFEVCTWHGALTFSQLTDNQKLKNALSQRFEKILTTDTALLPIPDHVDYSVFGCLPLLMHLQNNNTQLYNFGMHYANVQWDSIFGPRVNDAAKNYCLQGYSWQTRLWIDDMYMITILQTAAFKATHNEKYLNRTAAEMVFYLIQLQKPNGLFFHASNVPQYWGRGNGWMAVAMAELLTVLPKKNENYKRILNAYKKMMVTLLTYQAKDGMWRQLVTDSTSWKETSCSGMFTYAFIKGIKNKWLSKKQYQPAALKAWNTLITYINANGEISEVCEGTGANNNREYYLTRNKLTGDFHGQAPILWCANAILQK